MGCGNTCLAHWGWKDCIAAERHTFNIRNSENVSSSL